MRKYHESNREPEDNAHTTSQPHKKKTKTHGGGLMRTGTSLGSMGGSNGAENCDKCDKVLRRTSCGPRTWTQERGIVRLQQISGSDHEMSRSTEVQARERYSKKKKREKA
jgi:hypothetical protein